MTDLLYILSPSFSGSTLLTFLLGTHPEIATVGELKATARHGIEEYDCSCGSRMLQCGFWREVGDKLKARGFGFDCGDFGTHYRARPGSLLDRAMRTRLHGPLLEAIRSMTLALVPGGRRTMRRITEKNRALIDVVTELQNGSLFLDSSKDPIRLKYLLGANGGGAKVIHLIRDGRGTSNSYLRHVSTMEQAALEWRHIHEESERMLARLPAGSWTRLHYEDLCRDPKAEMDRLLSFLDLDPTLATHDFRSGEHHIVGNYMRMKSSSEIVLDEKWRKALSPEHLAGFHRVGGALNKRYGYT